MLTKEELAILKNSLPKDWVSRVTLLTCFKPTFIRKVLNTNSVFNDANTAVIEATISVAADYKAEKSATISRQQDAIKNLSK